MPMNQQRARLLLPFAIVIALLAVSTASIFIRFAQRDAPSLVIAALRLTFATFLLAPVALTRHRDELHRMTRFEIGLAFISGMFLSAHFATWITSLEYTSIANSVVLVTTGPLWVALLAPVLLKEHLKRAAVIGLALALLGGTIIGLSDACVLDNGIKCPALGESLQGRVMWGNFLALAGAWSVSIYLIIGRKLRAGMSLIPYIFVVYGFAALGLIFVMFVAGETPFGYPGLTYWWILLLAVFPQLIGHSTYNWALRYLPAAFVAVLSLGEPIGSAVLAFFIFKETPGLATIIGGALILLGIYLAARASETHEQAGEL
jgi:drug/metabolite transporter (DMT)-like permease